MFTPALIDSSVHAMNNSYNSRCRDTQENSFRRSTPASRSNGGQCTTLTRACLVYVWILDSRRTEFDFAGQRIALLRRT